MAQMATPLTNQKVLGFQRPFHLLYIRNLCNPLAMYIFVDWLSLAYHPSILPASYTVNRMYQVNGVEVGTTVWSRLDTTHSQLGWWLKSESKVPGNNSASLPCYIPVSLFDWSGFRGSTSHPGHIDPRTAGTWDVSGVAGVTRNAWLLHWHNPAKSY